MTISSFFLESSSKIFNLLAEDYSVVYFISVRVTLISNAANALYFLITYKKLVFYYIEFNYLVS